MPSYDGGMASGYVLRLNTSQASQSIDGNYSVVNWYLEILKGSGSGKWADGPHYFSVNINGSVYSGSIGSYNFTAYSQLTLLSGSTVVGHNADGTATIGVSGSFDDNNTWGELGDSSCGGAMGLTTIPRATTPTFTNPMTMGVAYTINLPRASAGFTHTVQYAFGAIGFTTIATGAGTSTSWTPPTSLASQIPNNASGVGTIRVITYSGATQIGIRDVSVTLQVPASMVPDFTTITHAEATAGVAANVGKYVQAISTLALAITGAVGVQGSTIASYKIEVAGQSLNAQSGTTPQPIATSGAAVTITGTVTDTRGRTKSKSITIEVLAYTPPQVIAITGERALGSGVPNDDGAFVRVNINAAVKSLMNTTERNALTYKIYSKLRGTATWTLKETVTPGGVTFNSFDVVGAGDYLIEDAWDFKVEIIDDFATTAYQFTIAVATIFMHWDSDQGVGIGRYRQVGMLDVAGQIYQNDGLKVIDESMLDISTARVPALLDGGYRGPGPAPVWLLSGGGQIGPLEWDVPYVPNGSREVLLRPVGNSWRIAGQDDGGQMVLPLTNGWNTYNNISVSWQWEWARVTKLISGIVVLSGMIQKTGTIANGELIGVLPVGMRPDYALVFGVNNSDTSKYIVIEANGNIKAGESMVSGGYISLDGIAFPAAGVASWTFVDPAGTAGSDHTFQNGWREYLTGGGSYGRTRYWKDPYGFIWTQGMIAGGTWTHNTQLFLWGALRSWKTHHIATSATAALGVIGVSKNDTGPRTRNGTVGSVWFSCTGPAFVTQEARDNNTWWDYPSKANGWVSFSYIDEYSNLFSECKRADGLTILYGMLASGTIGGGMGYTQPENVPRKAKLFHVVSADARGRLDIGGQYGDPKGPGLVTPQQGSSAWFAADSIKYVT